MQLLPIWSSSLSTLCDIELFDIRPSICLTLDVNTRQDCCFCTTYQNQILFLTNNNFKTGYSCHRRKSVKKLTHGVGSIPLLLYFCTHRAPLISAEVAPDLLQLLWTRVRPCPCKKNTLFTAPSAGLAAPPACADARAQKQTYAEPISNPTATKHLAGGIRHVKRKKEVKGKKKS